MKQCEDHEKISQRLVYFLDPCHLPNLVTTKLGGGLAMRHGILSSEITSMANPIQCASTLRIIVPLLQKTFRLECPTSRL